MANTEGNPYKEGYSLGQKGAEHEWKRINPKTFDQVRSIGELVWDYIILKYPKKSTDWKIGYRLGFYDKLIELNNKKPRKK